MSEPRRGSQCSSLHRTPPRPSGSPRKPAGTISRRPPYSNFARTCKVAAKAPFSLTPGAARSLLGQDRKGPRRAPRGGERRRRGAGAVFAAGGNGAERTLRRRQWGAHPPWKRPPVGAESPAAAGRRPNRFPWSPRPSDFPPDQRGQEVDCPAGETSRSGMPGPAGSGTAPSAAPQKYLLKILPWTGTFSRCPASVQANGADAPPKALERMNENEKTDSEISDIAYIVCRFDQHVHEWSTMGFKRP